jgi:nuclease HARBI1
MLLQQRTALLASIADPSPFVSPTADVGITQLLLSHRDPPDTYERVDVSTIDDTTALERFRFTIEEIRELVTALGLPSHIRANRVTVTSLVALCMLLRRLTFPNRLSDLYREFGYDDTSLSFLINEILDIIVTKYRAHLELWTSLTPGHVATCAQAVTTAYPAVSGIWGFLDGTFRRVARPSKGQRDQYSGYKRSHGQQYQAVITPDGIIVSLKGASLGSRNDLRMWHESGLDATLTPLVTRGNYVNHLYGDKAYQGQNLIMAPYRAPLTPPQKVYNAAMSGLRVAVEHGFGRVTSLWAYTDLKKSQKTLLVPTASYYYAMVLFTNLRTCMNGGNQISEQFDMAPPSVDEYLLGV